MLGLYSVHAQLVCTACGRWDNVVKADSRKPQPRNARMRGAKYFGVAAGHALARDPRARQPLEFDFGSQDYDTARRHIEKLGGLRAAALQKRERARL